MIDHNEELGRYYEVHRIGSDAWPRFVYLEPWEVRAFTVVYNRNGERVRGQRSLRMIFQDKKGQHVMIGRDKVYLTKQG